MLVELKIQCECGTKYKFDVEPLNGRLPAQIFCPGCDCDGTAAANVQLRQKLAQPRESLTKTTPLPKPAFAVPPVVQAELTSLEPALARAMSADPAEPRPARSVSRTRFAPGAAGAVGAGVVATVAWFFLIKATGYQLGFAAWGVGLLIGMGARGLGREGSRALGGVAAGCAFLAILAGQLLAAQARTGSLIYVFGDGGVGISTALWLLLAVGSAWKLGVSGSVTRDS